MVTCELQKSVREQLEKANMDSASFESKEVIKQVFGDKINSYISVNSNSEAVNEQDMKLLNSIVQRRIQGEPLQYIFGEWEFYGRKILCRRGVLIPRPETELLVDLSLELLRDKKNAEVLDLCCGTGCIGLTIGAETGHKITLADISPEAVAISEENAAMFGVLPAIIMQSVFDAPLPEKFDLLVSNPPYIVRNELEALQREVQFEPKLALDGGEDGLDFYREIISSWKSCIKKGGYIALEVGKGQAEFVANCLRENGFSEIETRADYEKIPRMVSAKI